MSEARRISLMVRVYVEGMLHSEERIGATERGLSALLPSLGEKHARLCAERPTMIEIEFLDEPDINQRFFRIGTDSRGMVRPMQIGRA